MVFPPSPATASSTTPPGTELRRVLIVSDIHHAGESERARGDDFELSVIRQPLLRAAVKFYRHFYWMRHPTQRGRQFDRFLKLNLPADYLVANGDYCCDSAFVGVSDAAARESAAECLGQLRAQFGDRARFVIGDHELGKLSMFGGAGGMRLASWRCATEELGLPSLWRLEIGNYLLVGVTSSLLALPAHQTDTLPDEWPEWLALREAHLAEIRDVFGALRPEQRVILFCHDPTALPFLWREETVRRRLSQVEQTIIGHLHTNLILRKSRLLSGIPTIRCLGNSVKRWTGALHEARRWWPFNVRLCPALAGIELLNDGGYYVMEIDPAAKAPAKFTFHPMPRRKEVKLRGA